MAEVLTSPISDRQDSTVFSFESERRSRESTAVIPYVLPRPITISESGNQTAQENSEGGIAAQISLASDDIPDDTNFDRGVTKFGCKKVLEVLDECMPFVDRVCTVSNLYPFMIAASCKGGHVSVIYHLVRKMPSFVHCTNHFSNV